MKVARVLAHQPKTRVCCEQIEALARQLGPATKLPTALALRDTLQVSLTTLDRALTEVEQRGLIYRVRGIGIFTVPHPIQIKSVCLVCEPSFFHGAAHSPFWDILVERARRRAADHNEEFSCHFALPVNGAGQTEYVPLHSSLAEEVRQKRVQGVLGVGLNVWTAEWFESRGVPFVAYAGPGQRRVKTDHEQLVRLGVRTLKEQGCLRIGFWQPVAPFRATSSPALTTSEAKAFEEEINACGLPFDAALVRTNRHLVAQSEMRTEETHQEQGYRTALEVFRASRQHKRSLPDGILITDDMMTYGALTALRKMGLVPGRDVRIATHSNRGSKVLFGYEDELTRLEIDPGAIVQAMFSQLEGLMAGEVPEADVVPIKAQIR